MALTEEQIHQMYPKLNERGVRNYVELVNRVDTPEFKQLLAERKAANECLVQPRIAGGTPWKGDCLVHGVEDTAEHYFETHPDASTD